jgi:protein-S-isoprenylcysteine O-methyltransferase Ste14
MDETSTTSSNASGTSSGGSPTGSMNTNYRAPAPSGLPIPPPLIALILLAGGLLLHSMSNAPRGVFGHHILGLLIIAGGTGLSFYAAALFQARNTTKDPRGEATAFVVEMPYTFTRNPMYLGLTLILFGFAVFFSSIAMLLAPIAFFIIIDRMVIPLEEQNLERLFGPSYLDYQTRVRRWL